MLLQELIKLDWAIPIISGLSLLLSLITLYIAHLRGPSISIALPDRIYPCHGLYWYGFRNRYVIEAKL